MPLGWFLPNAWSNVTGARARKAAAAAHRVLSLFRFLTTFRDGLQTAFDARLDLADAEAGEAAVEEFNTSRRRLTELREEVARCCEF